MRTTEAGAPAAPVLQHQATHLIHAKCAGLVGLERLAKFAQRNDRCLLIGNRADAEFLGSTGCVARIECLPSGVWQGYRRWMLARSDQRGRWIAWDAEAASLAPRAHRIEVSEILALAPIHRHEMAPEARSASRKALGVREDELLVGLLCNAPTSADVFNAASVVSFLACQRVPVRLLVHPKMSRLALSKRHFDCMGVGRMLLVNEMIEQPWKCAPLLDAAMLDACAPTRGCARAPSSLPAVWTLTQGVPTLVHASIDLPTACEDRAIRFTDDRMHAIRALGIVLEERERGVTVERAK